jgi:hypothetical protein
MPPPPETVGNEMSWSTMAGHPTARPAVAQHSGSSSSALARIPSSAVAASAQVAETVNSTTENPRGSCMLLTSAAR